MAKQPRPLTGQVAAITGGARGIGRATAQALVREGMKVAIGDIDLAEAQKTAQELGGGTVALELNVTDRDSVEAFLDGAEAQLGPLDVLVNNAGIMQLGASPRRTTRRRSARSTSTSTASSTASRRSLPRFMGRSRGHLVNIASSAGKAGFPGGATYCGTKHFVVGFSEAVRGELRDTNVEVSCVMPGIVNTELAAGPAVRRAASRTSTPRTSPRRSSTR